MEPSLETLNEQLYVEWARNHGLKPHPQFYGNAGSLRHLVDKKYDDALKTTERDHYLGSAVFDHARYFVANRDRNKVSVIATAPYEKTTLEKFGSKEEAQRFIFSHARDFGVHVRVGHPEDVTYLSRISQIPIIPIIWWNPDRFSLPYPDLSKQFETHRHRWQ